MRMHQGLFVFIGLALLAVYSGGASAKVVCGGEDTAACGATRATFVRAIKGNDSCQDGGFVDPINGGECWKCPEGFVRSWRPVTDKDSACIKPRRRGLLYKSAINLGKISSCPSGQFYDPRNGGECWSCPEGYERTTAPVDKYNACVRVEDFKKAVYRRKGSGLLGTDCPSGEFWDPNGNCYKCPSGYNRSAYPVTDPRACSRAVRKAYSRATLEKNVCDPKEGRFPDLGSCWKCPAGYDRTILPVNGKSACVTNAAQIAPAEFQQPWGCDASKGEFWDAYNTRGSTMGTCWKCPDQYERDPFVAVHQAKACRSNEMRWENDPYDEPGLYDLGGSDRPFLNLLIGILGDSEKLAAMTDFFYRVAEGLGKNEAQSLAYVQAQWKLIKTNPASSPALKAFVFETMKTLLLIPKNQRSREQKRLLSAFADYISDRRLYVSMQAMAAYRAWQDTNRWLASQGSSIHGGGNNMAALFGGEIPPPDFQKISQHALEGLATSGAVLSALGAFNVVVGQLSDKAIVAVGERLFPYALQAAAKNVAGELSTQAAREAAILGAKAGVTLARSVGPQVVFAIATIIIEARLNQVKAIADAEARLQEAIDYNRRNGADLDRMMGSQQGLEMMMKFWSLATQPEGRAPTAVVRVARSAAALVAGKGFSRDAADYAVVAAHRSPVLVGNRVTLDPGTSGKSGNALHRKKVTGSAPAASRQGHDTQSAPGKLNWRGVKGTAHAISIGADGVVWVIGGKDRQRDAAIFYRDSGKKAWVKVKGGDAMGIASGPEGEVWIRKKNDTVYRGGVGGWTRVPGRVSHIASAANGDVWAIGDKVVSRRGNKAIFKWSGASWKRIRGEAVQIAVTTRGEAWVVTNDGSLFHGDGKKAWAKVVGQKAHKVIAGADGSLWLLGQSTDKKGNYPLFKWDGKGWKGYSAAAVDLAVTPGGQLWAVNKNGHIYRAAGPGK